MSIISKESFNKIYNRIWLDKEAEVSFERYFKNSRFIGCYRYFDEDFFKMSDREQNIVMFVLSMIAKIIPNSGSKNIEYSNNTLIDVVRNNFKAISSNGTYEIEKKHIDEKFNRMTNCRNSCEMIRFINCSLSRYIDKIFNAYELVMDLNRYDFNQEAVLKKWQCDEFYSKMH